MSKINLKLRRNFIVSLFLLGTILNLMYLLTDNPPKCFLCIKNSNQEKNLLTEQKQLITNKILFWEEFLSVNKTYIPGLIRLSNLYIKNNEYEKAKEILNKVISISPNSAEGKSLLGAITSR
ncbi:MAG: tetratricopeptide repeat protein [Patescibacteria group bacterium]|nr:tetratricopeptide repeat protein [Patescibacteria group bacterium]